MAKNWKRTQRKFFSFLFFIINCNLLSLGLHKGNSSYRRSIQPSKKNIQHFKKHFKRWNLLTVFYFSGQLLPSWVWIANPDPDMDPGTSLNPNQIRIRIRIRSTALGSDFRYGLFVINLYSIPVPYAFLENTYPSQNHHWSSPYILGLCYTRVHDLP